MRHPPRRQFGIDQQPRLVGEAEEIGIMQDAARGFCAADHPEMVLEAVEPGEEDDAALVMLRRRLEEPARKRDGRIEDGVEAGAVARLQLGEGRSRCRRDRVEDAEQAVRKAPIVAADQLGIVEVVAGIHRDAFRQAPPHGDLLAGVEQRDLDAVDLVGVLADQGEHRLHGRLEIAAAPITGERRIEHLAEPVQDHLAPALPDQGAVHGEIIVGALGDPAERAARHQDDLAAMLFNMADLLLIGADHVIEAVRLLRSKLVGAGAAGEVGAGCGLGLGEHAGDQLGCVLPVQPHAALGGIHRFGDLEAEAPEMAPEG